MTDIRDCFDRLVQRYGLQPTGKARDVAGIRHGMAMHVTESDGILSFLFLAPSANVGDEILEHFAGFKHVAAGGVPVDWFQGRVDNDQSCILEIDSRRLREIGLDRCLDLPDRVSHDFAAHGATEPLVCVGCLQRPAVQLLQVGETLALLCQSCDGTSLPKSRLGPVEIQRPPQPVLWKQVWPRLLLATLLATVVWGGLQIVEVKMQAGLGVLLFIVPLVYGFAIPYFVLGTETGVNLGLSLVVALAVLGATLAGNIVGFWAVLERGLQPLPWQDAVGLYFSFQLVEQLETELPYLFGGVFGAMVGCVWLRKTGRPAA